MISNNSGIYFIHFTKSMVSWILEYCKSISIPVFMISNMTNWTYLIVIKVLFSNKAEYFAYLRVYFKHILQDKQIVCKTCYEQYCNWKVNSVKLIWWRADCEVQLQHISFKMNELYNHTWFINLIVSILVFRSISRF